MEEENIFSELRIKYSIENTTIGFGQGDLHPPLVILWKMLKKIRGSRLPRCPNPLFDQLKIFPKNIFDFQKISVYYR